MMGGPIWLTHKLMSPSFFEQTTATKLLALPFESLSGQCDSGCHHTDGL